MCRCGVLLLWPKRRGCAAKVAPVPSLPDAPDAPGPLTKATTAKDGFKEKGIEDTKTDEKDKDGNAEGKAEGEDEEKKEGGKDAKKDGGPCGKCVAAVRKIAGPLFKLQDRLVKKKEDEKDKIVEKKNAADEKGDGKKEDGKKE